MKARNTPLLNIEDDDRDKWSDDEISSTYYVPFDRKFILHPNSFVLAMTLEWIRIPKSLLAMVTGKSSWGRRGLIIETAPGVHPGYVGCLTLEMTNVGEVPIELRPGIEICQLFLHQIDEPATEGAGSKFVGRRRPIISGIEPDEFARKLYSTN